MSKTKVSTPAAVPVKPTLKIGDLLWCRETKSGQLWWPAMVTYDPNLGIYFKKTALQSQYHVQYFGISAIRGWVHHGSIQPFTDPTEKIASKGMSKKVQREYEVAMKEVTQAWALDHKQRKLRFIFNFAPKNNSKRKKAQQPTKSATEEVTQSNTTQSSITQSDSMQSSATKANSTQLNRKRTRTTKTSSTKKSQETPTTKSPPHSSSRPTIVAPSFVVPEPERASKALGSAMPPEPVGTPIQMAEIIPSPTKPIILSYPPVPQCLSFPLIVSPSMNVAMQDSTCSYRSKPGMCTCAQCLEKYAKTTPLMAFNVPPLGQLGLSYHPNGSLMPIVNYSPGMVCPSGSSPLASPSNQLPVPLLSGLQSPVGMCVGQNPTTPLPTLIGSPYGSPVKQTESIVRPDNTAMLLPPPAARVDTPFLADSSASDSSTKRRSSRKRRTCTITQSDLSGSLNKPGAVADDELEIPIPAKKLALGSSLLDSSSNDNSSEISTPSMPSAILTPPTSSAEESSSIDLEFDRSQTSSSSDIFPVIPQPKKPKKQVPKIKEEEPTLNTGVCCICDQEDDDLLPCDGHCYNLFHLDCLGLIQPPNFKFVCDECLVASSSCFACGKSDGELLKCNKSRCPKLYHISCIEGNKLVSFDEKKKTSFVCPLHVCARCTSIGTTKVNHSNLLQCTRCPLALHRPDCTIAGCELLNQTHMICYRHVDIKRKKQNYSHQNLNTCLDCGQTGDLFCCDVCSAAYHMECLEKEAQPSSNSESWKCPNCAVHDLPMYGSVVICKFGFWRWWPSEVIHPKDVPDNIVPKKPGDCMFVVRFCGSQDYSWMYHGRVLTFTGAGEEMSSKSKGKSSIDVAYQKACAEALELYKSKKLAIEEREAKLKPVSNHYTKIRINKYLVPRPQPDSESLDFLACQCTPKNPCNDDSMCVNRAIHIECDPKSCPVGKLCQNQRMKKLEGAKTTAFYTGSRGWGLKADVDLSAGDFVVEYVGEVLDTEMCRERLQRYHENNTTNFYMLTLDGGLVIDASQKSNHARFINHSCDPNCESQKWRVRGEARIGIFARYDIPKGTELSFDYHLDSLGNDKKVCLCGSKNCSGFLGVKSKATPLQPSRPKQKKKKPKSKDSRAVRKHKSKQDDTFVDTHEDDCFLCKDGGELLLCDVKGCSKAYHLQCLARKVFPSKTEKWMCPRHYCQDCQKPADTFCSTCFVSYCSKHNKDKFSKRLDTGELICILFCKQVEMELTQVETQPTSTVS